MNTSNISSIIDYSLLIIDLYRSVTKIYGTQLDLLFYFYLIVSKMSSDNHGMHYAIMDRIKQCYDDEIEIYHRTTMIIEYNRSCAIINASVSLGSAPQCFTFSLVMFNMLSDLFAYLLTAALLRDTANTKALCKT